VDFPHELAITTTEYFGLEVAISNWGIVVKLIVEHKPSSRQAVMHYFLLRGSYTADLDWLSVRATS
jgi:hypothetical protein